MKSLFTLLILLVNSLSFAHTLKAKSSFSQDEKLFSFSGTYDSKEERSFGFSHARDFNGSKLLERSSRIWIDLYRENYTIRGGLIYSKDNEGRVGKGLESSVDYYLNNKWTLLLNVSVEKYSEDIFATSSNLRANGNEDYNSTFYKFGVEYLVLERASLGLSVSHNFYNDKSLVTFTTANGIFLRVEQDFATRAQYESTIGAYIDYKFDRFSIYYSLDRSTFVKLDEIEYWNIVELSYQYNKAMKLILSYEYENIDDNSYGGLGLAYRF